MAVRTEVVAVVLILVTAKVTVLVTSALINCCNAKDVELKDVEFFNVFSFIYSQ